MAEKTDSSDAIAFAIDEYSRRQQPVDVSFRELVPNIPYGDRATHFLHPYPGKLLAHIPQFFLSSSAFVGKKPLVLDPFCGSGTTLVEAAIMGLPSIGVDVNPFAVMLSRAKTTIVDPELVNRYAAEVVRRMRRTKVPPQRHVPNAHIWYAKKTFTELLKLRAALDALSDSPERTLMLVLLAGVARTLSFADPRLPVPVRVSVGRAKSASLRQQFRAVELRAQGADVSAHFLSAVQAALARYQSFASLLPIGRQPATEVHCASMLDQGVSSKMAKKASIVITSPPYCGAQKYVRSTTFALAWLTELSSSTLADLEAETIGREHIRTPRNSKPVVSECWDGGQKLIEKISKRSSARAKISATYLNEMETALSRVVRSLRPGGHLVFVIGDNLVAGIPFPATRLMQGLLEDQGMKTKCILRDAIPSRGLMTKRNSPASPMQHEHVIIMKKGS